MDSAGFFLHGYICRAGPLILSQLIVLMTT